MADYITKIRTNEGDLPYDYNSLANLPEYQLIQDTTLESDISKFELKLDNKKDVVIVFDGRMNVADDSATNAEAITAININTTRSYLGKFTYIRPAGTTFTTLVHIKRIGDYFTSEVTIFSGETSAMFLVGSSKFYTTNDINQIDIFPQTSGHLFKAGSIFKVYVKG